MFYNFNLLCATLLKGTKEVNEWETEREQNQWRGHGVRPFLSWSVAYCNKNPNRAFMALNAGSQMYVRAKEIRRNVHRI